MDIKAFDTWPDNGHLIADVASLYLSKRLKTLDPTYGLGTFWNIWRPHADKLVATDKNPRRSPSAPRGVDFRELPFKNRQFAQVVYDPPYKLNGTPELTSDDRYGTEEYTGWRERLQLISDGLAECCRVCNHILLVKCQDQVSSGHVRWQSHMVVFEANCHGFGLMDQFFMLGGRSQPAGRQVHARRNASTLLVLQRGYFPS